MDFTEIAYFHVIGKKPAKSQKGRLNILMNLCANPGIRDESVRVAMNVAIGKGPPVNAVLAGLLARSGEDRGARWVEKVMENLRESFGNKAKLRDCRPFSGLGLHFGDHDFRAKIAMELLTARKMRGKYSRFLRSSATEAEPVLLEGIVAAHFLDLHFTPVQGSLFFLFACAPAMIAFSLEQRDLGLKNYPNYFERGSLRYCGPSFPQNNGSGNAETG